MKNDQEYIFQKYVYFEKKILMPVHQIQTTGLVVQNLKTLFP